MSASSRWRAWLLGLCVVAALTVLAAVLAETPLAPWNGTFGWQLLPVGGEPYVVEVVGADRTQGAFRSGVRVGDRFDLRDYSPLDRFDLTMAPLAGHAVRLRAMRDGSVVPITARPTLSRWTWDQYAAMVALLWTLIFAAFVAWRKPEMPDARWVCAILATFVFTDGLTNSATPYIGLNAFLNMAGALLFPVANLLFILFASTFGRPLSPLRRRLPVVAYVLAAAAAVRVVGISMLVWFAPSVGGVVMYLFGAGMIWFVVVPLVEIVPIVCGALAISATHGAERQRAAWFVGTLSVFFTVQLAVILVQGLTYGNITAFDGVVALSNFLILLTPVGLTYAVLNRRLLDVGFVLNRAVVFTGVSLVVISAFVLLEWGLSRWVAGADRISGIAANLGLVLVLGFSLRFIHGRVDRFVDHVFFRRRHENEAALRRFGHEAAFITDREILIERTIAEVQQHADAASVAVLLHEGKIYRSARLPSMSVSENDPAILSLRAGREPIDLHGYVTAIAGELAFPMLVRGELRAVLVCGPKRGGETFAPDEYDALVSLAAGVGSAIDALRDYHEDVQRTILEELRTLSRWIRQVLQPGSSET